MPSSFCQSKKTFQIKFLPEMALVNFKDEIEAIARNENKGDGWKFGIGLSVDAVAVQAGQNSLIGTITCQSEEIKLTMMKRAKSRKTSVVNWNKIAVIDEFDGLTILHSPMKRGTQVYPVPEAKYVNALRNTYLSFYLRAK